MNITDEQLEEYSKEYGISFNQVKTKLSFGGKTLEQWCTTFNFVVEDDVDFLGCPFDHERKSVYDATNVLHRAPRGGV